MQSKVLNRALALGFQTLSLTLLATIASARAGGTVTTIGPFAGDKKDKLETISTLFVIDEEIDVFQGDATFISLAEKTNIHLWGGSSIGGDSSKPKSGSFLIGATTAQAIVFNAPTKSFGCYWTNTSSKDDAIATFYDSNGVFLGAELMDIPAAGKQWHWNGWTSSVPLGRIEIHGEGFLEGFLWCDDLQLTFAVPATSTVRNGTGANELGFASVTQPIVGANWDTTIATSPSNGTTTAATAVMFGFGGPTSGIQLLGGELLVLGSYFYDIRVGTDVGTHSIALPADASIVGVPLYAQGLRIELTPAFKSQLVFLNALDLMLGT